MKNQFTSRIVKFTFAFMFILIASSCSEDNDAMDAAALAQENSEIAAKGAKVSATVTESFNSPTNGVCAGVAADFCFTAAVGTNLQVQQLIAGEWVQVYQISQSTLVNTCFPLTFATEGTYQLRYKIGSGGFTQVAVNVIDCSEGCEESFSYADYGGGSYTFTYVPAEDMEDVNVEFTFAQGVTAQGLEGFTRNGKENSSVWSATRSFEACKSYTYTVTLTPDCSGNSNSSNVWTDFKVGGESKKGELANIVIACSN